jgi:hypothetical protein
VPSISGQASTATASAPARVFETSEHRDTDSGQLLRLAAIRNAGPDDSHAMVRIAAHLPYQVGGGAAVPDKENVAHEPTAAAATVYELSR